MIIDNLINKFKQITGINGQVYHAEALKNAKAPFIFWYQTGESITQTLSGYTELRHANFEVSIVAANLASLEEISEDTVEAAISAQNETYGGYRYDVVDIEGVSPTLNEHAVNLYRKSYNIRIDYQKITED